MNTEQGQCLCTKLSDHADEWESSDHHTVGFESNMYHLGVFLLQIVNGHLLYVMDSLVCGKRTTVRQREFVEVVVLVRFLVIEREIWAPEYLCEPKLVSLLIDLELKAYTPRSCWRCVR
jgi:hypothetical protein